MLNLITGVPGSGKTLFVVDSLKSISNRPIFYFGIPDLSLPWVLLSDPFNFHIDLPDNSIVVIDEAQQFFPVRDARKPVPDSLRFVETHRHSGVDLYFITQHPSMLDVHIRRLAGKHYHLKNNFGSSFSTLFTCESTVDPKNFHELKSCQKSIFKFPKKSFDLYKSAEIHNRKFKLPKLLLVIPIGLALIAYLLFSVFQRFDSIVPSSSSPSSVSSLVSSQSLISSGSVAVLTADDFVPSIPSEPGSAPVFRKLWVASVIPKLSCISSASKCLCYTQQGSRYFLDDLSCRRRVKYGYFDITLSKKDKIVSQSRSSFKPVSSSVSDSSDPISVSLPSRLSALRSERL